nr:type IV secretory system conjugative DNA transfer family protein [Lachnospiraceae bacterium]
MSNSVILGKGIEYSLDCYETKLNNNIIVTGTSGAGKTRGIVEPAILAATGSYVISDPKGNLYHKYRSFLELKGYRVMRLDFTDPNKSANYNFFNYIHNTQDILKIAHMLIYQRKDARSKDPFWDESNQLLLQSLIAYLWEIARPNERTFGYIMDMLEMCQIDEDDYR